MNIKGKIFFGQPGETFQQSLGDSIKSLARLTGVSMATIGVEAEPTKSGIYCKSVQVLVKPLGKRIQMPN